MRPETGLMSPVNVRTSVVLPQPLLPMSPVISPARNRRSGMARVKPSLPLYPMVRLWVPSNAEVHSSAAGLEASVAIRCRYGCRSNARNPMAATQPGERDRNSSAS